MAKKAIIILAEGFEEIEAVSVIDILRRAEIDVTVAGLTNTLVTASRKTVIAADTTLSEVTDTFDAYILPGGMPGAKNLAQAPALSELLKKMNLNEKIIAAICAAPAVVLTPLGILEGKTATCFPSLKNKLSLKTTYSDELVVTDHNVITSRGPATAILFALAIVEKLAGKEKSDAIRKATLLNELMEG